MEINKKSVVKNFVLNLVASILPVFVLQILIYPYMSRIMGGNEYGLMLTVYSLLMMIVNSSSVAVSDLKILYNKDYKDNNIEGDFPVLMRKYLTFSVLIMVCSSFVCYENINFVNVLFVIVTVIALFLNSYMHIELVLNLQYNKICINSFCMAGGYLIGVGLYMIIPYWELLYLMTYFISSVYLFFNTTILKESCKKTRNYKRMRKESLLLFFSSIISNSTAYADKIVLFPLIGGGNVAIYYTASFIGKTISLGVTPVNRLILGYIANMDRISNKKFFKFFVITLFTAGIGYGICMLLTKPIMSILYPQWIQEVMIYAPVTTATAIVAAVASMIQPFLLRYTPVKWQTFIQTSSAIIYFCIALLLFMKYNLMGFCLGGAIGSVYKVICMVVIYCKFRREGIQV